MPADIQVVISPNHSTHEELVARVSVMPVSRLYNEVTCRSMLFCLLFLCGLSLGLMYDPGDSRMTYKHTFVRTVH